MLEVSKIINIMESDKVLTAVAPQERFSVFHNLILQAVIGPLITTMQITFIHDRNVVSSISCKLGLAS